MRHGFTRSTCPRISQWSMLGNLLHFGSSFGKLASVMTCWTLSHGTSYLTENTRPSPHTRDNSLGQLCSLLALRFGRFEPLPKSSSSLGLLCKIDYGQPTALREEDGRIVEFARYASGFRNRLTTFLSIVDSLQGFGAWLSIGLVFTSLTKAYGWRNLSSLCGLS